MGRMGIDFGHLGAHVAYIVIDAGRTHMQISHMLRKKQHGPSFSPKCICSYGPMKSCCAYSHIGPSSTQWAAAQDYHMGPHDFS